MIKRLKRTLLAFISDAHAGFKLGLMRPGITLTEFDHEGKPYPYMPEPTKWSEYLWHDIHIPNLKKLKELAKGDPIIFGYVGDPTHGNKYPEELYRTAVHNQIEIATDNFKPIFDLPNLIKFILITSTDAHVFGESSADHLIFNNLRNMNKDTEIGIAHHGLLELTKDFESDISHHGPGGGIRKWLEGNVARFYLRSAMFTEIMARGKVSKLYVRAHYHVDVDVSERVVVEDKEYFSRLILLPSMCGPTSFSRKSTKSTPRVMNGMIVFEIVNDEILKKHRLVKTTDIRTVITL